MAELLKVFERVPPLSLLRICNPDFAKYATEQLLQHSDDLDFVQDILSAAGDSKELNPLLNSVLAGFGRRKRYGRFKCGQLNLHFDQLRFAGTTTPSDEDLKATDVLSQGKQKTKETDSLSLCRYFQRRGGCRFSSENCRFTHKCIICDKPSHGAANCYSRNNSTNSSPTNSGANRRDERPPHPRFRRERANNT